MLGLLILESISSYHHGISLRHEPQEMSMKSMLMAAMVLALSSVACAGISERLDPVPLTPNTVLFDLEPLNVLGAAPAEALEGADTTAVTRRALRRAIHQQSRDGLYACLVNARTRNPLTPGSFDAWLQIEPGGTITAVQIDDAIEHPTTRACLFGVLNSLNPPSHPGGGLTVAIRFRLDFADPPDYTSFEFDDRSIVAAPPQTPTWRPFPGVGGVGQAEVSQTSFDEDVLLSWPAYNEAMGSTYGDVAECYDLATTDNPDIGGRITATLAFSSDGSITSIAFDTNTSGSPMLVDCVRQRATTWKLPAPPTPNTRVSMSWLFDNVALPLEIEEDTGNAHSIRGRLDKAVIQDTIAKHQGALQSCYVTALLEKPDLTGRVQIGFWIHSETGTVTDAHVEEDTTQNWGFATCLAFALETVPFPAAPGGDWIFVRYPLVFATR